MGLCSFCEGKGFIEDDGEYNPRSRRMEGCRKTACRVCHGKGVLGEGEDDEEDEDLSGDGGDELGVSGTSPQHGVSNRKEDQAAGRRDHRGPGQHA